MSQPCAAPETGSRPQADNLANLCSAQPPHLSPLGMGLQSGWEGKRAMETITHFVIISKLESRIPLFMYYI